MPDRVIIPAALRDEITADLEAGGERTYRWGPAVLAGTRVIADVGRRDGLWIECTAGGWLSSKDLDVLDVGDEAPNWHRAAAWAPVGGVDGGPRPDIGDRVLVLDAPGVSAATGLVATVEDQVRTFDGRPSRIECRFDPYIPNDVGSHHGRWDVARWAILPPAPCWVCSEPDHGNCPECDEAACQGHDAECSGGRAWATYADDGTRQVPDPTGPLIDFEEIDEPDQPVDPLTANPDHAWPCADYCCTRGCPGIGNTLHGPPWPCDATRCTCGNTVIRAVAHDRQRLARILTDLTAWLTTERDRLHTEHRHNGSRESGPMIEARTLRIVLDRLRDQGLDVDYLAEPDTREQT